MMRNAFVGKKYLYLLVLCGIMMFALVGCGDDDDNDSPTTPIDQSLPGTLHAILCIADHESDIGEAGLADMRSISNWLDQISQNTGMPLNKILLTGTGSNLTQSALTNTIAGLSVNSNDVILFYYTGHGAANENPGGSKWPLMAFLNDELVDYAVISEQVKAKGARFVITMADCCNNYSYQAKHTPFVPKGGSNGFQTLFLQQRGHIVMSAASKGEFSLGGIDGGMFTNQFLSAFYSNASSDSPSWQTIMQQASQMLGGTDENGSLTVFHPQYDMNVSAL